MYTTLFPYTYLCTRKCTSKWVKALAGMKYLWEFSIRFPLRETFQRPLKNISKEIIFFMTSSRRLKYISKKMSFLWRPHLLSLKNILKKMSFLWRLQDVSNISQKDVYSVTCPRRIKNRSRKYLWFFKNTTQNWFCVISVRLLKYLW